MWRPEDWSLIPDYYPLATDIYQLQSHLRAKWMHLNLSFRKDRPVPRHEGLYFPDMRVSIFGDAICPTPSGASGCARFQISDGRVEADQSTPCVHCCKPLNPLQWCCTAFSPAWNFLYSIAYIAYWKLSIILMLQVPPWYERFISLFNNELNIGAHVAASCMLMHP